MTKTPKTPAKKSRRLRHKSTPKVVAEKVQLQRKTGVTVGDPRRRIARHQEFRDAGVPDTMRALAERNVVRTREIYERSKYTLQSVFENWQRSFDAAGQGAQGAMALNRRLMDIAERNINAGFDLATSLCRAKNLAEVMELRAVYWQKQFGERPRRSSKSTSAR